MFVSNTILLYIATLGRGVHLGIANPLLASSPPAVLQTGSLVCQSLWGDL